MGLFPRSVQRVVQRFANGMGRVRVVRVRRTSLPLEMGPLIHCAAPFCVGLSHYFAKPLLGSQDLTKVGRRSDRRVIEIVEQQPARLQMTVQHCPERPRRIRDVSRKPDAGRVLGLLLTGDDGRPFHRAGTGHPSDRFLCSELAPLADFPLEIRIERVSRGVLLVHAFGNSELTSSFGTFGALTLQLFSAPFTTALIKAETSPRLLLPGFIPVSTSWNATP